jgi:hypothetical protein
MTTFTFVSRRLRGVARRRKLLLPPANPSSLVRARRAVQFKRRRLWPRQQKRLVLAPMLVLWRHLRQQIKRPRFFRRPRKLLLLPALPSSLSWRRPLRPRLRRVRRRLVRHPFVAPAILTIVWKRMLRSRARSSRPVRGFRLIRRIVYAPPLPSSLVWKRPLRPKIRPRKFKPVRHVGIFQRFVLVWKRMLRPRLRRGHWRSLHRAYPFAFQPASFVPFKRFPRPKIKRTGGRVRRFKFSVIGAAIVLVANPEYIVGFVKRVIRKLPLGLG